ncbi:MAG: hypothetical protein WA736_01365 [Candidatus Acidiferrum sp.]
MKRGGLFLAAFLLIGGMLRIAGPGAASPAAQGSESLRKTNDTKTVKNAPKIPYLAKFAGEIKEFYGVQEAGSGAGTDLASYFEGLHAPLGQAKREPAQFVIATFPDPVHTHLGLFFDRSAEALQQAAQMKGFVFDRAVMPWERTPHGKPSDLKTRQEDVEEQKQRESYPGLLIFRPPRESLAASAQSEASDNSREPRQSSAEIGKAARSPLFVLVVGETPTAGVNREQFRNAVQIILQLRSALTPASGKNKQPQKSDEPSAASSEAKQPPMLILGPSFSGSLESLQQELQRSEVKEISSEKFVYSGTVTSTDSMLWFQQQLDAASHFASFQENDDFARNEFLQFASDRGYLPQEVAILSEDETVFGAPGRTDKESSAQATTDVPSQDKTAPATTPSSSLSATPPLGPQNTTGHDRLDRNVLKLHFPREISYFRSAYQKEAATQQSSSNNASGVATLPMNLDENGSDDDTVPPYAVAQTSLSQEAVMLGIVSELQKHHIKFTLLLASDPVDELFLASYLRKAYAQGRVVITAPDLLFAREGDPALRGVLGLNSYSLVPGLSDRLCRQQESISWHEDRLFVSSLSEGTYNAMAGLLSVTDEEEKGWNPVSGARENISLGHATPGSLASGVAGSSVPYAPYVEYGSPNLVHSSDPEADYCQERPLLWLTILGRDGFWPLAGLNDRGLESADGQIPIASLDPDGKPVSTLETGAGSPNSYGLLSSADPWETKLRTPPAWNIAYCVCLILLVIHAMFSWSGSILDDSGDRAQFTRNTDCRGAIVLALGALALASAFVLVMCTRNPQVDWAGFPGLTLLMWLPYPVFVGVTIYDLRNLREERVVAYAFIFLVCLMTGFQFVLTWIPSGRLHVYWSTRMLHITSGVSPVLPVLLLLGAAYWWMWLGLRGVCLVDLRRPRLPEKENLPDDSYRISDAEGEELRKTAHPFYFSWQVVIPVIGLAAVALIALHRDLPVQSVEGTAFDWGYTVILGVMVAAFLGSLLKLVRTWQKCHQVLAGLDRLPLRAAFSRMKDLSWHSFWNPGGSTLRETYKVMGRAMENLTRLLGLVENWNTPLGDNARLSTRLQIRKTLDTRQSVFDVYVKIFASETKKEDAAKPGLWKKAASWFEADSRKGERLKLLMRGVESLQKEMAKTAAALLNGMLIPIWNEEAAPVVSSSEQIARAPLPAYRAMAEEYVSLVYVNFLVSVLLRIRTLVISAGGMYVFIVMSMNVYPFEPHPALQTLAVVLLVVMGGAVGYVYAEMHRESILSRLTSTAPGELGLDFWLKFASAAAIPVFSLLAAQFPGINQFLFSWLEPALQAMK